ncbi:HAMP domain-containing sensor histidine kinase [Anaerocolumna sp.]|uniref:HAMP domain-containing sensor histidine kinase n=1 Tax=Anaerocolumna sp. TaxID=2041569 RepID=UPI0028B02037|nr:HAMP domain-containing sensor histidine kinase [Anaerocolumna sp.]
MERIKNMSLKKSFFTITILFLSAAAVLSIISIIGCIILRNHFFTPEQFTLDLGTLRADIMTHYTPLKKDWLVQSLDVLQVVLPIFFIILSLFLADMVFYRMKLKQPLAVLQKGAERIQGQDLDFTIPKYAEDELGTLCTAFETMRKELLKNNQKLWLQMEERKRLNAAFSHDLRNPVTVLKGSAKILQKGFDQGSLTAESARDTIALITQYTERIEAYVEAMTRAQKLEELKCNPQPANWSILCNNLKNSLSILSADTGKELEFSCQEGKDKPILEFYCKEDKDKPTPEFSCKEGKDEPLTEFYCKEDKDKPTPEFSCKEDKNKPTPEFSCQKGENKQLWIDQSILQNTAENLISNGLRYAKKIVSVDFSYEQDRILLEVSDDGPGFPPVILQKGATPFLRHGDTAQQKHFGMGLYICRLLCEKHGGNLTLENTPDGAKIIATFYIMEP